MYKETTKIDMKHENVYSDHFGMCVITLCLIGEKVNIF